MRIGIDIRAILSPHHDGNVGGGHYVLHLVKTLLAHDTKNEYLLLHDEKLRYKDRIFFERYPHASLMPYPSTHFKRILPGLYNEFFVLRFLHKANLDVLHIPLSSIRIPAGYRGKVVVSVYDLGVYVRPDQFSSVYVTRQKGIKLFNVKKSDALIVPHSALAEKVHDIFQYDKEKIHIVRPGVDARFATDDSADEDDIKKKDSHKRRGKKVARRYGIRGKYIIAVGTVEPVKNLQRLMHAFALFRDRRRARSDSDVSDYTLLIVGKSGSGSEGIQSFMRDLDLEDDVCFAGYVIGDDMSALLTGADMSIHPALYEGLGLSALEALVAGTPAAFSKISVHRELAGEGSVYFDPYDTHDIARAMNVLVEYGDSNAMQAREMLKSYNWTRSAEKTLEVYKRVVG